jgi:flavodoxin I
MKALVVYDTKYGNTELVAQAIAAGMGSGAAAVRVGTDAAKVTTGIDILVLGSPVIGGRPTKPMQEFIKGIPPAAGSPLAVATFDTRWTTDAARKMGYAADRMADQLSQQGYRLISKPNGFVVIGQKGPMTEGELERAAQWGKELAGL